GRGGGEGTVLVEGWGSGGYVAGGETGEGVEPPAVGPAGEKPGGARPPCRGVVGLAESRGHVAVFPAPPPRRGATARHHAGVAVVTGRGLADRAERGRVVVAAGDERRPRRATQRRRVEAVVPQPLVSEFLDGRRRDAAAEGRVLPEPGVVEQDEHD